MAGPPGGFYLVHRGRRFAVRFARIDVTLGVKMRLPADALERAIVPCIWTQGPGPWSPQREWWDAFMRAHPDIRSLCGTPLRIAGNWQPISSVTAEYLLHTSHEDERVCEGCLRALAARPVRCSAGAYCTGTILCAG
jgi:hypothetical protein